MPTLTTRMAPNSATTTILTWVVREAVRSEWSIGWNWMRMGARATGAHAGLNICDIGRSSFRDAVPSPGQAPRRARKPHSRHAGASFMSTPKALFFDVFGTLMDRRRSIAREARAILEPLGHSLDWLKFADAWRGEYQPSME